MSTSQAVVGRSGAWVYRGAVVLPDGSLPSELSGDRLADCIEALEAGQAEGWEVVRVKLSADDHGRSWLDVLLKQPASASQTETAPDRPLRLHRAA